MIRLVLAEDHETVRDGLKLLIAAQPDMQVIGEAANGRMALQLAHELRPTVLVLDVSMPEMTGIEAARAIALAAPGVAIVALTRYVDEEYVQAMLGAGVFAYVLKESESGELMSAIRAAAERRRYLDAALTERLAGTFLARHAEVPVPRLSEREMQVLRLIAAGHSNKEIGTRLELSVKTVEVHKANGMRKLKLRGRVDIIRYAVKEGWLLDG